MPSDRRTPLKLSSARMPSLAAKVALAAALGLGGAFAPGVLPGPEAARPDAGAPVSLAASAAGHVRSFAPAAAHAEVLQTDSVLGQSAKDRALPGASLPDLAAKYAILVGPDGRVFYERNSHEQAPIASMTKIMTAIVAWEKAGPDFEVKVSEKAAAVGESSSKLRAGDVLKLSDAVAGLLVSSGNDAAQALAESVGRKILAEQGTQDADSDSAAKAFVAAMNDKARELKMDETVFANPHGLDDGEYEGDQHSSAHDVAVMTAHLMGIEPLAKIVGERNVEISLTRDGQPATIALESTDELLGTYEGACGVKTGFTDKAGACFAGANKRQFGTMVSVVMHSTNEATRFTDTTNLFDWFYAHMRRYDLARSPETVRAEFCGRDLPLAARVSDRAWLDKTVPAVLDPDHATVDVFDLEGNVSQKASFATIDGDVKAGDEVGEIAFYQHNREIARVKLLAAQDVAAPNPFEAIGIWWTRVVHTFAGGADYADSELVNQVAVIHDRTQAGSAG